MSYISKWRKRKSTIQSILTNISDSDSDSDSGELNYDGSGLTDGIENALQNTSATVQCISDHFSSDSEMDYPFLDDSSSEEFIEEDESDLAEVTTQEKLAEWALKTNLTRSCVNELLLILRKELPFLPKDSRTLLNTPRFVATENVAGGTFIYFGIEDGLHKLLVENKAYTFDHNLQVSFNIDGVPLYKSSGKQFWPILCGVKSELVFAVAIFYGTSKPSCVSSFTNAFLSELNNLIVNGIDHENVHYTVQLGAMICDAPARSFLKCIVGHTGYHSCERCTIEGQYKSHRIVYNGTQSFPSRTDDEFSNLNYMGTHQRERSPFIATGIRCVTSFVLDYMHLCCLGVTRRILIFLKRGPKVSRLSATQVDQISNVLTSFSGKLPAVFARQPRGLVELDRWKATEFREFLLYTGILSLQDVLHKESYQHFLSLSIGIRILLDSNDQFRQTYLDYSREMLFYFVENAQKFYGDTFIVYNVHGLVHLPEDVRNYNKSLNELSAFPYENQLKTIKRLVKGTRNPLVEVAKRQSMLNTLTFGKKNFKVSIKFKESCYINNCKQILFVKELLGNDSFRCWVLKERYSKSLFDQPVDSRVFSIYYIDNFVEKMFRNVVCSRTDFMRKCIVLPFKNGYALFSLLHDIEK